MKFGLVPWKILIATFTIAFLVSWSVGDVIMTSKTMDPQEASLIVNVQTSRLSYHQNEIVIILGETIDSMVNAVEKATVGLEVRDPNNSTVFLDIVYSNENGTYQDQFRLHPNSILGEYHVYATASKVGFSSAFNQTTFLVEEGFHEISITEVSPAKTVVGQGFMASINVTICNHGTYNEHFIVRIYSNTTIIQTRNVTLESKVSTSITFVWNTTDVAKGNYTISAVADIVPGETNTTDNTYTDGWIIVAMIGDVTGQDGWPDGKCDIKDIAVIARLFGIAYPDSQYIPNYDLTGEIMGFADGKIDIKDIALAAKHFGVIDP